MEKQANRQQRLFRAVLESPQTRSLVSKATNNNKTIDIKKRCAARIRRYVYMRTTCDCLISSLAPWCSRQTSKLPGGLPRST